MTAKQSQGSLVGFDSGTREQVTSLLRRAGSLEHLLGGGVIGSVELDATQALTLEALVREMEGEINSRHVGCEAAVIAKLVELAVMAVRFGSRATESTVDQAVGGSVWGMDRIMHYVDEHFDEPFTLDEMATRCAMNTTTFSREFKRRSGSPLFEYLNKIRIRKACGLLKRTERPVIDIALDVGYNNVSFFNRYFRRIMGMSPTKYRAVARR